MDDLCKFSSKILYVRHGCTEFNMLEKNEKTNDLIKLKDIYLDCSLSDKGKLQIKEVSNKLTNINISTCFVSPLNRCLESISIALEDHPNKNNITIYIEPHLTEFITGSQHNISKNIYDKKRKYNMDKEGLKFNWIFFDKFVETTEFKENHNLYFLEFIDNKIDNFDEIKERLNKDFSIENLKYLLENYTRSFNKKPESYTNLLKRCKKVKETLKNFIKDSGKHELIIVMTHSAIIKMSSSKVVLGLDSIDKYPEDSFLPGHADTVEITI